MKLINLQNSKFSINKILLIQFLIIVTTSFSPFMESSHGHNFLFIAFTTFFILFNFKRILLTHIYSKPFIIFIISFVFSILLNLNHFRFQSLLFSFVLFTMYSVYLNLLYSNNLKINTYISIIKLLIFSFFFTLLIQQFLFYIDSEFTFNKLGSEGWKLNSLSLEPSLSGIIINILFLSYIKMKELLTDQNLSLIKIIKEDPLIYIIYSYVVFTSGSSFGILFYILIIAHFLNKNFLIFSFTTLSSIIFILYKYNYTPLIRILDILPAIKTGNIETIFQVESSAGIRIIPVIIYFTNLNFLDIHTFFGNGSAYSAKQLSILLNSSEDLFYGWTFPSFLIDHGIIAFTSLYLLIYKYALKGLFTIEFILFFITLLNTSINTQFFWIGVIFFTTNQYFKKSF